MGVSVVVERMYDWSVFLMLVPKKKMPVSVVVERMYDWSTLGSRERPKHLYVSVVVERMYDWSWVCLWQWRLRFQFQLLLKGCTIEAREDASKSPIIVMFQLLLKGCTIEAPKPTDWKQMIFDSWFLICFSKMVDLHKKCHYFRKFAGATHEFIC